MGDFEVSLVSTTLTGLVVAEYGSLYVSICPMAFWVTEPLSCFFFLAPPTELSHDQEEPDSAFEATQYFFEDITPETSHGA